MTSGRDLKEFICDESLAQQVQADLIKRGWSIQQIQPIARRGILRRRTVMRGVASR